MGVLEQLADRRADFDRSVYRIAVCILMLLGVQNWGLYDVQLVCIA